MRPAIKSRRKMMIVCNNILSLGEGTIDELQTAMPQVMIADQVDLRDIDRLSREMSMNGQIAATVSDVAAWALEQINSPEAQAALAEWRDD